MLAPDPQPSDLPTFNENSTFKLILISILILFAAAPSIAQNDEKKLVEPKNECNVPGAWDKLEELVAKYPHDKSVQILHALRIGLCLKIEQGSIDLEFVKNFRRGI